MSLTDEEFSARVYAVPHVKCPTDLPASRPPPSDRSYRHQKSNAQAYIDALDRVSAREGQAKAAELSRTALDSPLWRLPPKPKPILRQAIRLLGLPDDAADANGEPVVPDTDRLHMMRHKRGNIVRTASICDRQRALLFGAVAEVLHIARKVSDWDMRLHIMPNVTADPATAACLWAQDGRHLLRVTKAINYTTVSHMHVLAMEPTAREMATLNQQALDEFWRLIAGYQLPIFYSGDNAPWLPHYLV